MKLPKSSTGRSSEGETSAGWLPNAPCPELDIVFGPWRGRAMDTLGHEAIILVESKSKLIESNCLF